MYVYYYIYWSSDIRGWSNALYYEVHWYLQSGMEEMEFKESLEDFEFLNSGNVIFFLSSSTLIWDYQEVSAEVWNSWNLDMDRRLSKALILTLLMRMNIFEYSVYLTNVCASVFCFERKVLFWKRSSREWDIQVFCSIKMMYLTMDIWKQREFFTLHRRSSAVF